MHKSFEGLSALVERAFPWQLYTGAYFVFLNKNRQKIKLLTWEGDGYAIYYKQLEKGKFFVDCNGKSNLSRREFMMLFEGVKPMHVDRRFSFRKD